LLVSTQLPLHNVGAVDPHPLLQIPDAHTGVAPLHDVPHAPHVAGFERSASHPSSALPEQCAKPSAHDVAGTTHAPALHVVAPLTCGRPVQSCLHAPQFFASVESFVSQPLRESPSQSAVPAAHAPASSGGAASGSAPVSGAEPASTHGVPVAASGPGDSVAGAGPQPLAAARTRSPTVPRVNEAAARGFFGFMPFVSEPPGSGC
jgi:hypothetical protein